MTGPFVSSSARFEVTTHTPADGSTRARAGVLTVAHGSVETPQFMPVGTNATVKALAPDDIKDAGATIILANTYHLYLRPGHERIGRLGGLHRFIDWDRPILTDSGGFQVVSLGDLRVVDEDGVTFRSHLDGSMHRFTPEHATAVQEALGSDVAVAFDQPVYPSSPREVVADAISAFVSLPARPPTAIPSNPMPPTNNADSRRRSGSIPPWMIPKTA